MLSNWRIRNKLLLCIGLLLVTVVTLAGSSFYGLYTYRGLVKTLSGRSTELPVAAELSQRVSDLRVTLSGMRSRIVFPAPLAGNEEPLDMQLRREQFLMNLAAIETTVGQYREQLEHNAFRENSPIRDDRQERETLGEIETALARIQETDASQDWMLDEIKTEQLAQEVEQLHDLAAQLPSYLRDRLHALADDVRVQYRTAIILTWVVTIGAVAAVAALVRWFYQWIFCPLGMLIRGSREVAQGNFRHRIHLQTDDEMSDLAEAMNDMTERFQKIRDELDQKVQERTRQVVRSEQLASVGFLAAGVAHEINNPLASIAMCSESLEHRVESELNLDDEEHAVIRNYLRMIQNEAFRCKEITEKLLDYSRMGDVERQRAELRELVQGVIDMISHLGRYRDKHVELLPGEMIYAQVNAQELKQVVLNLVTNGLDSLDAGGTVTVELEKRGDRVDMVVADNGCGMTPEVLEHLFEPFFTRRRNGQGTGLGLSITERIIADHDGHITAMSDGPGHGSRFVIALPICDSETKKEQDYQYQVA